MRHKSTFESRSVYKKICFILVALLSQICAEEEEFQYSLWDFHPLHIGGQLIRFGKANCDDQPGHIFFRKSSVFLSMLTPISREHIFIPRVDLAYVTFDWNKNPKFNETHFYYVQFSLLYFTTAIEKWKWIARFDYNLQIEHLSHPGEYSLYNGLLWGSYQIHRKWHYHIGALGYAGLEGSNIYPIIGADFAPDDHWFFQLLFPINYSAEYSFADYWTIAFKGRPLKERLRVGSKEPQPRSIFSYSTFGAELDLKFDYKSRISFDIYGGYSIGGDFYIKDAYGHNALYADVNSAPYGGANLEWAF